MLRGRAKYSSEQTIDPSTPWFPSLMRGRADVGRQWQLSSIVDRLSSTLAAPLSYAMVPLLNGLGRRRMLDGGAEQHEARLDGVSINYYAQQSVGGPGSDMPILLIHGIADSALTWSFVFGALSRSHSVYAIDLPGYGYSGLPAGRSYATLDEMRDLLMLFLRDVIGRPALVVGNSMGGWLAVKLGWAAPDLLRGVILI